METVKAEIAWAKNMGLEGTPEYRRLIALYERLTKNAGSSD